MIPKVLTIAGTEASGGAGQLADLKVFQEYGVYGLVAMTCVVTMDPNKDFAPSIQELDTNLLKAQLDTAFVDQDIKALKTGMLVSLDKIKCVAEYIKNSKTQNIVIDPVMVCKQGDANFDIASAIADYLLPLATVATPNLIEAEALSGIVPIDSLDKMKEAAKIIHEKGAKNVVVKGGHRLPGKTAYDVFYDGVDFTILEAPMCEKNNNHGAGCTLAAAITAGLALDYTPLQAAQLAKKFVTAAVEHGFKANHFTGHVWHGAYNNAENRMKDK